MDTVGRRRARRPGGPGLRTVLRQAFWFVVLGLLATGLTSLLYLLLRQWMGALAANVLALALTTVASSEANRLLTFAGIRTTRASLDTQSVLVFLFYCFYNSVTLAALHLVVPGASAQTEATVLFLLSGLAGLGRFLALRLWVFGRRRVPASERQASDGKLVADEVADQADDIIVAFRRHVTDMRAKPVRGVPGQPIEDGGAEADTFRSPAAAAWARRRVLPVPVGVLGHTAAYGSSEQGTPRRQGAG